MENKKKYKNYLVIFIDMLGTQDKADINNIYADYSIFHETILSKDGKYITDGRNGEITSNTKIEMHAHSFSDCAYILYNYEDESLDSDKDIGILIENSLCHFERIILKLLENAIVFRGGVSYGKAFYEKQHNILFGPAINQAFQLEDKLAKNPRILVSTEVANIYNEHFQNCVEFYNNPNDDYSKSICKIMQLEGNGNLKEEQGRMVVEDSSDNNYIFNYLNSVKTVSFIGLPEITTFSSDFSQNLLSYAENKSREMKSLNKIGVKEKYDWLIEYIES